jgi:hypothetical protein
MIWMIILATIPVGLAGLALEHTFRTIFSKPLLTAAFLFVNGLMLLGGERLRRRGEVDLEVHARLRCAGARDVDGEDVAAMFGDDACELMQHTGRRSRAHLESNAFGHAASLLGRWGERRLSRRGSYSISLSPYVIAHFAPSVSRPVRFVRGALGARRYSDADMRWLDFLVRLRATGMSMRDMQRYAQLLRKGNTASSLDERQTLLEAHAARLEAGIRSIRIDPSSGFGTRSSR